MGPHRSSLHGREGSFAYLPRAEALEAADLLRYCPICDGFEHTGKRIGVIGNSSHGVRGAAFLKNFSRDVWFVEVDGRVEDLDRDVQVAGVGQLAGIARHLAVNHERHAFVTMDDGEAHRFDVLYSGLGVDLRMQSVLSLGLGLDDTGAVGRGSRHDLRR